MVIAGGSLISEEESFMPYSFNWSWVTLDGAFTRRSRPVADFGNAMTSLMLLAPHNIAMSRSKPRAIPVRTVNR